MRKLSAVFLLCLTLAAPYSLGPSSAHAATHDFSDPLPSCYFDDHCPWTIDGITAIPRGDWTYSRGGRAELYAPYDGGTPEIYFTMRHDFKAKSFVLFSLPFPSFPCYPDEGDDCAEEKKLLFENVGVFGYQNGTLVSELIFQMYDGYSTSKIRLGKAFSHLDTLVIAAIYPPFDAPADNVFYITDVKLSPSPVPLPAPGLLLAAGLVGVAVLRNRSRKGDLFDRPSALVRFCSEPSNSI